MVRRLAVDLGPGGCAGGYCGARGSASLSERSCPNGSCAERSASACSNRFVNESAAFQSQFCAIKQHETCGRIIPRVERHSSHCEEEAGITPPGCRNP